MLAATFFFGGVILGITSFIARIRIPESFHGDWDRFKANAWLILQPIASILISVGFGLSKFDKALWFGN